MVFSFSDRRNFQGKRLATTEDLEDLMLDSIVLREVVVETAPPVLFHNTDTFAAAAGVDLVEDLTYQPVDGSEHVVSGGCPQLPGVDWTRAGKTFTMPDNGFVDDELVHVSYAYDITDQPPPPPPPEPPEPYVPFVVGSTVYTQGDRTTVAFPAGTQPDDLFVLALNGYLASSADPRIAGSYAADGSALVAWGNVGDASALSVNLTAFGVNKFSAVALVVYRGAAVADVPASASLTLPLSLPVDPAATAAVGVVLAQQGTVSGNLFYDSTGVWAGDAQAWGTYREAVVEHWSGAAGTMTGGDHAVGGSLEAAYGVTIPLMAAI